MPVPAEIKQAAPQAGKTPAIPPAEAPPPPDKPDASKPAEAVREPPASGEAPVPERRPDVVSEPDASAGKETSADPSSQGAPTPDPAHASPPLPSREELACRTRLSGLGAQFKEAKPSLQRDGCWMPFPVEVTRFTDAITIEPPVTVNCAMAESAARFLRDVASPAAKQTFGSGLKSIAQASGFVCRPRNGTTKLSEHAFGNALDIASFRLEDGRIVPVRPSPPEQEAKFLSAIRASACGPFKTVLGPGSNADHAEHFHIDLEQRRNGGTFCK